MIAVVLAAGRGTRMGELTRNVPKPMVQVAGKPTLEHIVRRMAHSGISQFLFITRYLSETIEAHFGDGSEMGVSIQYARQSEKYGTGAALMEAKGFVSEGPLMMVYGDIITSAVNYSGALKVYKETTPSVVMTLNWVADTSAGSSIEVDDRGLVRSVVEKPPKGQAVSNWNSSGIFVFHPVVFDYLARLRPSKRGEYELPDALNAMISDGLEIRPYYLTGEWRDIGTPEDVAAAERALAGGDC